VPPPPRRRREEAATTARVAWLVQKGCAFGPPSALQSLHPTARGWTGEAGQHNGGGGRAITRPARTAEGAVGTRAPRRHRRRWHQRTTSSHRGLEAAPGFEPGMRELQSLALPLGYAANPCPQRCGRPRAYALRPWRQAPAAKNPPTARFRATSARCERRRRRGDRGAARRAGSCGDRGAPARAA
jgi:hypothetical protein